MTYDETLEWLYHLEVSRGWDLKLESVREALERLGAPQDRFPTLHVAGTNGKGSTAAIAQAVLSRHGLRVGLFTSPHLSDFRERIRIGEEEVSPSAVVDLATEIRDRLDGSGVELTFFELTTVLAFLHFARAAVDAAIIEVGLGGRLDATNVVVPRAAVVTTIGFDHERYLGSTLGAIAEEKAGIFKAGVPAVVGRVEGEAAAVLARASAERGSTLVRLGRDFTTEPSASGFHYRGRRVIGDLRLALRGRFQIDNAAVALAALEAAGWMEGVSDETVRGALAGVRWPGRLEVLRERPRVIVDGAHNPAGMAALAAEVPVLAQGRPIHLIFGVLSDKRWQGMVEQIASVVSEAVIVPVAERRSEDPERVAAVFRRFVPTRIAASGASAFAELLDDRAIESDVVLVAGSLFLVGEVRRPR